MIALRIAFLVVSVIFIAGVTIWFAFVFAGDGGSAVFAAVGPALLVAAVGAHFWGRKR